MSKKLTITVPDDAYASLQSAAGAAHRTPEELATEAVLALLGEPSSTQSAQTDALQAREAVLAIMRSRHHLAERVPDPANTRHLPPLGSPERAQLEAEIADELGQAFKQSGLSVLDLIERR